MRKIVSDRKTSLQNLIEESIKSSKRNKQVQNQVLNQNYIVTNSDGENFSFDKDKSNCFIEQTPFKSQVPLIHVELKNDNEVASFTDQKLNSDRNNQSYFGNPQSDDAWTYDPLDSKEVSLDGNDSSQGNENINDAISPKFGTKEINLEELGQALQMQTTPKTLCK